MIEPSIEELTKKIREKCEFRINRYELVLATAKAARIITDEQNEKREEIEKATLAAKDAIDSGSKSALKLEIKEIKDVPDEKMVKSAIQKIHAGDFLIVRQ
jgi:DNA-directed RNA polymerase subunit K/omega